MCSDEDNNKVKLVKAEKIRKDLASSNQQNSYTLNKNFLTLNISNGSFVKVQMHIESWSQGSTPVGAMIFLFLCFIFRHYLNHHIAKDFFVYNDNEAKNSSFIQKEISTLEQHLDECRTENSQIKEINMDLKARLESAESRLVNVLKSGPKNDKNGDNFSQDIDTILKLSSRLQEMNNSNKSLKDENETLKEVCNTSCGDTFFTVVFLF